MVKKLFRAGSWVFAGLLLGRAAGFIRESLLASRFGISGSADTAVIMFTVPDQLLNILVGGSMGAALIPEFKRLDGASGKELYLQINLLLGAVFSLMAGFFMLYPDMLVGFFAPGFDEAAVSQASFLLKIVLWVIPLTALAAVSTAYLQSNNRFAVPSAGTLIINAVLVFTLIFFVSGGNDLHILAWSIIAASLIRLATQYAAVTKIKEAAGKFGSWRIKYPIIKSYFQALSSGSILLAFPIVARMLSTFSGEGALAAFNYASKLIELPLGLFLTAFSVVLFPKLTELFFNDGTKEDGVTLAKDGMRLIFILSFSLAVSLIWFAKDIAGLAFGWGKMGAEPLSLIGSLTAIGMLSLPAQGLSSLTVAALYAKRDMKTPFRISVIALALFIPLAWAMRLGFGLEGLMAAIAIIHWFILASTLFALRKAHGIDLIQALTDFDSIKTLAAVVLAFFPVACLSVFGGLSSPAFNLLLAALGSGFSLLMGLLAADRYRGYIFARIFKR